jgi:methionine-rich copper-binding protein CopC
MLKSVAILFLVTFFVHSVQVCPSNLEIRLLNDKRKEMAPGTTSNVLITLSNHSDSIRVLELKLKEQDNNWRQIMDYSSIRIEENTSISKIISIKVPENVKAGDYSIVWEAFEKPGNQLFGKVSIPIRVLPTYEIRVVKQNVPGYLLSGDTLGVKFMIQNLSNTDVKITTTTINGQKPEIHHHNIPKDSSILTNVSVYTAKNLDTYSQQSVTLSASVTDKPEISSIATYWFDIIPSENVTFDGYNRLPVKISGVFATSNRLDKRYYALMYDIRGGGLISEDENKRLDFHFRGPDRRGDPILGMNDEYNMSYRTKKAEIYLGDHNYNLSDLTESSRIGRGIKLQYNLNKFSVGSFYHSPRYYPGVKRT